MVSTTIESIDYAKCLVVGKPGQKHWQPFERDRLLLSLHASLAHRPTALADAGGLAATIITKVAASAQDGVVTSQRIIETSLVALNRFDTLAAQHYQAMHRQ